MLRTIKLYGSLAIDTGVDEIKLDVNNTSLLFRGLEYAIPDFKRKLSAFKEVMVICTRNYGDRREVIRSRDIRRPFEDCDTVHVVPAVEGDISAAVAALIAAGVGTVAAYAIVIVGALALMYGVSALAQSLAPKPKTSSSPSDSSFIFTGPQNTANQGGAIPILYGTCLTGSVIIASNYQTLDVPIGTVANTSLVGGFDIGGGH